MVEELKSILQAATAPMVLISGTGIFLLTINARFLHAVGRMWEIDKELSECPEKSVLKEVMKILKKRCIFLRRSMGYLVISVIASSLLMILTLSSIIIDFDFKISGVVLLAISCLFIAASMVALFMDVLYSFKGTMLKIDKEF